MTFMDLYVNAEAHNKPAVQAAFIHDCVEQGKILDASNYALPNVKPKVKRGRPSGSTNSPTKTPRKDNEKIDVKPKITSSPSKKAANSTSVPTSNTKSNAKQSAPSSSNKNKTSRTPSPPPPTKPVAFVGSRNRYTQEEMDYCLTYAALLYKRDPDISWNALIGKIAKKVSRIMNAYFNFPEP